MRSFSPNQTAASLAGAFKIKGYPIAAKTYPKIQISKPELIKHLTTMPTVVSTLPSITLCLHPFTSIR
jgi:hypothetical protein